MDDKDIEFAVRIYQKNKKKNPAYTYDQFLQEIRNHKCQRPMPYNYFDPFSSTPSRLWGVLEMSIKDLVDYSGLNMAKFSRRFCIPYRTLQAWCDGTNPCPVYTKLMIAEILGLYSRIVTTTIR